jgi:hypothetical protein
MKMAGDTLTESQKRAVAMYLTGKLLSEPSAAAEATAAPPVAEPPAAAVEPPAR